MVEKRCFKRNDKMVISSRRGDILIPSLTGEVMLIGDTLYAKEVSDVYLENRKVERCQTVQPGDRLLLAGLLMTIYKAYILIEGELTAKQ